MSTPNSYLPTPATTGIGLDITFVGTPQAMVQQLIDVVSAESRNSDEPRNRLDGMYPDTRDHLVALLVQLKSQVPSV